MEREGLGRSLAKIWGTYELRGEIKLGNRNYHLEVMMLAELHQRRPCMTNAVRVKIPAAAAAKSLQSCPTLCDPIDSSPQGSPVPGIL